MENTLWEGQVEAGASLGGTDPGERGVGLDLVCSSGGVWSGQILGIF